MAKQIMPDAQNDLTTRTSPPRLLLLGQADRLTGFGRVLHSLAQELHPAFEIVHFGIDYSGVPIEHGWHILPNHTPTDPFGTVELPTLLAELQPQLIFMCHDPWLYKVQRATLARHTAAKTVFYCPIDGPPLGPDDLGVLAGLDRLVCYTEYGRQIVTDAFAALAATDPLVELPALAVLPHGVDLTRFYPLGGPQAATSLRQRRQRARAQLFPERPELQDSFIVLNANRNTMRKRIDLTLDAFARFARDKPANVWLYLHMGMHDQGTDVLALAQLYGIADRLLLSTRGARHPTVSDEQLNLIYNACDVGINTASGEGWGLIAFEHAATGAAQLVPDHTGCGELWRDAALLIPATAQLEPPRGGQWQHIVSTAALAELLDQLYSDPRALQQHTLRAYTHATAPRFQWPVIASRWSALLHATLAATTVSSSRDEHSRTS